MSKKRKLVEFIGGLLLAGGLFELVCTAGASDLERIPFSDVIVYGAVGLLLFGVGYLLLKLATGGGVFND